MGTGRESKMSEKDEKKQDLVTVEKEDGSKHIEINQKSRTIVLDFDHLDLVDDKKVDFIGQDEEIVGSFLNSDEYSKIVVRNGMSYSELSISEDMAEQIGDFLGV